MTLFLLLACAKPVSRSVLQAPPPPLSAPAEVVVTPERPSAEVRLENTGAEVLQLTDLTVASAGSFRFTGGHARARLAPGESTVVYVAWRPTEPGFESGALIVRTEAGNLVVPLSGRPSTADPAPLPEAAWAWRNFADQGSDETLPRLGVIDKSDIDDGVRAKMGRIRACYVRELERDPRMGGSVTVRFVIAKDGKVAAANVKHTTFTSGSMEQCVVERFVGLAFPAPSDGPVIVTYPFIFSPA